MVEVVLDIFWIDFGLGQCLCYLDDIEYFVWFDGVVCILFVIFYGIGMFIGSVVYFDVQYLVQL